MFNNPLTRTKGLTLIEVLITIVVFSSGIVVILGIITNSLSLGARSRNRTTATMLAKEGLEMIYNIRDTNLDKAQSRGCLHVAGSSACTESLTGSTTGYIIVGGSGSNSQHTFIYYMGSLLNRNTARLNLFTGGGITTYRHEIGGTPSIFYRYITISPAVLPSNDSAFVNSQIKKIVSTVEYSQLGGTGKVQLESFIGLTR